MLFAVLLVVAFRRAPAICHMPAARADFCRMLADWFKCVPDIDCVARIACLLAASPHSSASLNTSAILAIAVDGLSVRHNGQARA